MNEEKIKEVEDLNDAINDMVYKRRKTWKKLPSSYRWSHGYDGKNNIGAWAILIAFLLIMIIVVSTSFGLIGSQHLNNGVSYECPGHDWHGNTSQMISMTDTYNGHINYYCPVDGQLIGYRGANEPIPIPIKG